MNPYEVLGITPEATEDQIKRAFRKLSHIHHPDKNGDPEVFRQIQLAYQLLSNPASRRVLDTYGFDIDFFGEAKKVAINVFLRASIEYSGRSTLTSVINSIFEDQIIPQLEKESRELEKAFKNLSERNSAILEKPEDDFLSSAVLKKLAELDLQRKEASLTLDIHREGFRLLKEYKLEATQIGEEAPRGRWSFFEDFNITR